MPDADERGNWAQPLQLSLSSSVPGRSGGTIAKILSGQSSLLDPNGASTSADHVFRPDHVYTLVLEARENVPQGMAVSFGPATNDGAVTSNPPVESGFFEITVSDATAGRGPGGPAAGRLAVVNAISASRMFPRNPRGGTFVRRATFQGRLTYVTPLGPSERANARSGGACGSTIAAGRAA